MVVILTDNKVLITKIQNVYILLQQLTDGEEDTELVSYYDDCLNALNEVTEKLGRE